MTPTQLDPRADIFCTLVFDWLNGKSQLDKKGLAEELLRAVKGDLPKQATPTQVKGWLNARGITIKLQYAVMANGIELRLEHMEDLVDQLNKLRKPRQTEVRQGHKKDWRRDHVDIEA